MYQIDAMKILVAEDNPINQQILEAMIRLKHWDCKVVNNGEEAVEASLSGDYDLIFMDLNMPLLDGIEATRKIRNHNRSVPIIAVTAYTDEFYKEETLKVGMNGFIAKPFTRKDIYEAVQSYCPDAV